MTGKQHAVLWLGLSLIVVRLFTTDQWSALWSVLHAGASSSSGNSGNQQNSSGSHFHRDFNPFIHIGPIPVGLNPFPGLLSKTTPTPTKKKVA